jgi:hypothetical protein
VIERVLRIYGVVRAYLRFALQFASGFPRRAFAHPKFAGIAQEFFTEAAVLVFVFPVLDTIVQFGKAKVTIKLALGSIGVAVLLLSFAGIIARGKE